MLFKIVTIFFKLTTHSHEEPRCFWAGTGRHPIREQMDYLAIILGARSLFLLVHAQPSVSMIDVFNHFRTKGTR